MRGGRGMISGEQHTIIALTIRDPKDSSRIVIQCGQEPVLIDVFGPRDQQRLGVCRRDRRLERCRHAGGGEQGADDCRAADTLRAL